MGERNAPVDGLRTVLGSGDGFAHVAQEERACCKHLDVDESQYLHLLDVGDELGAIAVLVLVAIY